jgi:hypothetical protein
MALIDLNHRPAPPSPGDDDPAGRPAPARRRLGLPEPAACPHGSDAVYLLLYNDPATPTADYAVGWSLSAWTGSVPCWCAALTAHGAGALTGPRHAKAVALRALRDRGVPIERWTTVTHPDLSAFRAVLEDTELRGPEAHTPQPGGRGSWRRGRWPGH